MFGGVANLGVDELHGFGEIVVVADAPTSVGLASGLAIFVVHIDHVDIAGHVQLACTQLAHAHNPQHRAFAVGGHRRAVQGVQLLNRLEARLIEAELGQLGDGTHHDLEWGVLRGVEHDQALDHELAQHAQRVIAAVLLAQGVKTDLHRGPHGRASRQGQQVFAITAAQSLHQARMHRQIDA